MPVKVCFCYVHEDEPLLKAMESFLSQYDLTTCSVGLISFFDRVLVDLKGLSKEAQELLSELETAWNPGKLDKRAEKIREYKTEAQRLLRVQQMLMPVEIFCCYARKDQPLLNELKSHLSPLQRQGLVTLWADTDINAGSEWEREIKRHLNTAQIILLLVSPDFMASDYCYSKEMKLALERHQRGDARVIPIILRPVYWQGALGKIQALPTNAKPVIDRYWHSMDEAFFDVAEGIRKAIEDA